MALQIVSLTERPDMAVTVATWKVAAFGYPDGETAEHGVALLLQLHVGPEETFVLFDGTVPVGTAGLSHDDLDARPDLTPWLAGVYVEPAHRGRGHATALVRRVEAFAAESGVRTLWLYTSTAEALYARLGWRRIGTERDRGRDVVLMTRLLNSD